MASPQVENGHLKIANEVWDSLFSARLGGSELALVACIIRHSWGWHKKECELSVSQVSEYLKIAPREVARSRSVLVSKNIIQFIPGTGRGNL